MQQLTSKCQCSLEGHHRQHVQATMKGKKGKPVHVCVYMNGTDAQQLTRFAIIGLSVQLKSWLSSDTVISQKGRFVRMCVHDLRMCSS